MKNLDEKRFEEKVQKKLKEVLIEFSNKNDFNAGAYAAALTKHCINLNYDFADNPLTAAGFISMCWSQEMKDILDSELKTMESDETKLIN